MGAPTPIDPNADFPCASQKLTLLSFLTPCLARPPTIFHAVTATVDRDHLRMMKQPVEQGSGKDFVLECVIMPLSLIVLLLEAILGAVSHLLLLNIPSRACLWLAGIQSVCPPSASDE